MTLEPAAHLFPVSVKGVAVQDGKVLLVENERHEWELPFCDLASRGSFCVSRSFSGGISAGQVLEQVNRCRELCLEALLPNRRKEG